MNAWPLSTESSRSTQILSDLVAALGDEAFGPRMLGCLQELLPTASMSVYRTGPSPALYFSSSLGVPDRTGECWRAYLSGPYRADRTLSAAASVATGGAVCHIAAHEMPAQHRGRVYEPYGVAERISVIQQESPCDTFAVNFYRHDHQRAFLESELDAFTQVAPALLALARKQVQWTIQASPSAAPRQRLAALCPRLTLRELDVCERLLRGMTQDGIASDLGLSVTSVKTYRSRAFDRLGIHFRSQLAGLLIER